MKTKRLVMAGVMAMALAGGAGTALALGGGSAQPVRAAAGGTDSVTPAAAATVKAAETGPRVVRPYQPVEIGQGAKMGLLPQGRQNYVVAWEDFEGSVERAKAYVGDSIRPNSLSGGLQTDGDDALFSGAFRTDTVPARITVRVGTGPEQAAGMLMLPGEPGWGTYYLDAAGAGAPEETTRVTAYGADGAVLATLSFEPFLAGR
ncbi:hypothetical protein GLX30_23055 [Streptomyces sp. Tu 2975]|uniref:hypothetical protein n=1 Tax=Streptomyces sp. Tu 2975 TaxID=2676871 RepID=UPI001358A8DB|nr:hypothetical protein [Streptomyces sp. Tu 2975]QIP86424.1 hypothetical protein GLX30_23055 [Streptomyces sp. Tu 2975]